METKHTVITAAEGRVLTDGTVYGKTLYLAEGADPSAFYEITEEEYAAIIESEPAEAADYEAALERFGVR